MRSILACLVCAVLAGCGGGGGGGNDPHLARLSGVWNATATRVAGAYLAHESEGATMALSVHDNGDVFQGSALTWRLGYTHSDDNYDYFGGYRILVDGSREDVIASVPLVGSGATATTHWQNSSGTYIGDSAWTMTRPGG